MQGVDEAEADGVGTGWWLIGPMHALAELVENAMRLSRVWVDSGIREAQLGDALGHGGEGSRNGSSSERLFGGLGLQRFPSPKDSVAGSVGEEHLDPGLDGDIVESAGQLVSLAPLGPMVEGLGVVAVSLFRACSIGNSKSKAAPIVDAMLGRRWTSFQGRGCGCCELKWSRREESVRCCRRDASSAMTLLSSARYRAMWQCRCCR